MPMKKISIKDVGPNPHRNPEPCPLDKGKITLLRASINETGFWEGIMVRPHPTKKGKFQLAYGHHRLEAACLEGIREITVFVRGIVSAPFDEVDPRQSKNGNVALTATWTV